MLKYIWLVPLLPLIGAAINGLLGRKLRFSERLIGSIAVGSVVLSFLISVAAVYSYGFGGHAEWPKPYLTSQDGFSFNWIPGGAVSVNQGAEAAGESPRFALLNIEWSYQLDPLSSIFMLIVTGVGLCIFVFATGYMHGETGFYRFFAYMGLFMFAMLVPANRLLLRSPGSCERFAQSFHHEPCRRLWFCARDLRCHRHLRQRAI